MNFLDARSDSASDRRVPRVSALTVGRAADVTGGRRGIFAAAPKTFNGILTARYWISAVRFAVELCCRIAGAARTNTISSAGSCVQFMTTDICLCEFIRSFKRFWVAVKFLATFLFVEQRTSCFHVLSRAHAAWCCFQSRLCVCNAVTSESRDL